VLEHGSPYSFDRRAVRDPVSPRAFGRSLNERAESHWHLRDRLSPDRGDIAFPRDPELIEELLAIRWRGGSGGKVQIVEKSEVRARIGRSPDKADALAMLFQPERHPAEPFLWRV
jgi:hypothetical protein